MEFIISFIIIFLFKYCVQIIIFLAGIQKNAASAYVYAIIDGASPWVIFWKITLPAMSPFFFLNLIYTVVDMFTFPFNPILDLVDTASYGYSSTLVWIYILIIVVFLLLVMVVLRMVNRSQKTKN